MSVFLETARLRLRDKEASDCDFLASLSADPRVMRWIGDGSTYPRGEIEARLARVLEIDPGAPILFIERLLRCRDGHPVEFGFVHMRGDRIQFRSLLTRRAEDGQLA